MGVHVGTATKLLLLIAIFPVRTIVILYQRSRRLDTEQETSKETLMKADAKVVKVVQQQRRGSRVRRRTVDAHSYRRDAYGLAEARR